MVLGSNNVCFVFNRLNDCSRRKVHHSLSTMTIWLTIVFCLVGVGVVSSKPLKDPNICGRPTCGPVGKFHYQAETRYQYQYSVDVSTLFAGTSKNDSRFHVDAEVGLDFISQCEGILKISSVSLTETASIYDREEDTDIKSPDLPQADKFSKDITEYTLKFSFQDGIISEICPNASETSWVLNFKRGILSAFQNTMKRFDVDHQVIEMDVNGNCDTTYTLLGARETSLAISKKKDTLSCTSRYKHHSVVQTTPYNFPSSFKSSPLVRSTSSCELTIDHKIYSKIDCEEVHIFQPFSNQASGARTTTRQILTLLSEKDITVPEQGPVARRSSLIFDHDLTPKPTSGELKASRELIKTMCRLNTDDVQLEYPDIFTKFIHTARLLSYPTLTQVITRASTMCTSGKKHVLDALPLLGSNAAITVMKDLILKDEIPSETTHEWLLALAFLPRPDLTTVKIITPLLHHKKADAQFILSISSVVHTYCKYTNTDCGSQQEILDIIDFLEEQVTENCRQPITHRALHERAQVALKALGNMGISTPSLKEKLKNCIINEPLPMVIRIGAIEAHRRFPCQVDRDFFLEIYRNQSMDSEIRIASYLQVMRCPIYLVVTTIRHTLHEEEVNQVGSFVWSHLRNLLSSSIPSRIEIQGLLQDKDLVKKFSSDIRKFSRNYEGSMFFDEYNVGGNIDSNLIFSPKSFIPRSAMVNLTVDLFGESVNAFEVGGRMEGFEHYIESFFGPRGPLSANAMNEHYDKYKDKIRFARSLQDDLKRNVDELPNVIDNNFNDPKATLGLKIFGNEIAYKSIVGDSEIRSALTSINPWENLKQLLSGKEVTYNKAALFLDTSVVIPTGIGLPVTLSAVGTAAVNLKMSGKLKASDFKKNYELDLEGKLRPSVAIDVVGVMGVDAYYASTGIKIKTNLYSSAAVEGQVKVRGSKLVSVEFSLPKDRTDIVSARSELVVMRGETEELQAGITDNRVEHNLCSWPSLDRTLGLNLCVDFQFPNASSELNASQTFLNGPTNFGLSLRKADLSAKKYLLEYKWESTNTTTDISLMFNTPGSKLPRELSAKLNLDMQNQNLTLILQSADSRFVAIGTYKNTEYDKYINFGLDINGKKHLDAQLELKTEVGRNGTSHTYIPRLYIAINNEKIAQLTGHLKWVEKKDIAQCEVKLEFITKKLTTRLQGYLRRSDVSISGDLTLRYKFEEGNEEHVQMKAIYSYKPQLTMSETHGQFDLESSAYKQFNFGASFKYQKAPGHVDFKLEINTNPDKKDDRYKLTLQFVMKYVHTHEGKKINTYVTITKPISDIDLKFSINYHEVGQGITTVALVRYATGKEIIAELNLVLPTNLLYYMDLKLNISVPSFTPMLVALRLHEKTQNDYDIDFSATWFSGHIISAKGLYQDKSLPKSTGHSLKLLIKSPSFNEVALNCRLHKDNEEFRIDLQADYNNDKYGFVGKTYTRSHTEFESFVEINYKGRLYSMTTSVNLMQTRQVLLELHLDTYRDIHLALRGMNKKMKKEAGIEIKWDANRDPGQKFAASIDFAHPESMNYSGGFMVSFPGRTVKGSAKFGLKDNTLISSAHLDWSPKDVIDMKLHTSYEHNEEFLLVKVNSELLTPFENWKRTSLNGGLRYQDYLIRANGSVYWQDDQHIALDVFGEYLMKDDDFRCEMNSSIVSTIPQVSSMSGSFSHKQNRNKYLTNILMQYNPRERISLSSDWILDEDPDWTNLTGIIHLLSPFPGYQRGEMRSKFQINKDMDIKGGADLELEKKKYTLALEGHLKQITNSMLFFNITTPIQKYHSITGRFGYSEAKRHLVAEVKGPTGATGIEILLSVISSSNFDVLFHVATPIEHFQKMLLVGKLKSNTADFRCGWNNLTLGFTGVWHYENISDFEYSYKIYTPLEGFEENGLVAKFIHKDKQSLDFEMSVKLADIKLGVKVQGEPKPQVLHGLDLPKTATDDEDEEDGEEEDEEEEGDAGDKSETANKDDKEEDEEINWRGFVALDVIVYPTFTGILDIEQRGTKHIIQSSLILPNGTAELYDEFNFKDVFSIKNILHLKTPYDGYKELTSNFVFKLLLASGQYVMAVDANLLRHEEWKNSGLKLNYTIDMSEEGDVEVRHAILRLDTPFENFQFLDAKLITEIEDNIYRTNFTVNTNESALSVNMHSEIEKGFFEASFSMFMDTPTYKIPRFKVAARRDFVGAEKIMELMVMKFNPDIIIYGIEGAWHYEKEHIFKTKVKLHTPLKELPSLGGSIVFIRNVKALQYSFDTQLTYGMKQELRLAGLIKGEQISIDLETPLEHFRRIGINGTIKGPDTKMRTIVATVLYDDHMYEVDGDIAITDEKPLMLKLSTSHADGKEIMTVLNIEKRVDGFAFDASLKIGVQKLELVGDVALSENSDWSANTKITSTHPVYNLFDFRGHYSRQDNGNVTLDLDTTTSVKGLEKFRFAGNALVLAKSGKVKALFDVTKARGDVLGEWSWILFENMAVKVGGSYDSESISKHVATELFYKNPRKSFKYMTVGTDVNLNRNEWQFGLNGTLNYPTSEDLSVLLNLKLPPPNYDIHTIMAKVQTTKTKDHYMEVLKYFRANSKDIYGTSGELTFHQTGNIYGNLLFEWGGENVKTIRNIIELKRKDKQVDFSYNLKTPKYDDDTLIAKLFYDQVDEFHTVKGDIHSPSTAFISGAEVNFNSFSNMNGIVNTTTPFETIPYIGMQVETVTTGMRNKRYAKVFWPNDTAFLDSSYTYHSKDYNTELNGSVIIEVPLATRHVGKIVYDYKEEPLVKTGYSFVEYNMKRFLEGKYKCDSESSAGFDKDTINIEIENNFHPIGVLYIHQHEYSGGHNGLNLPTTDTKRAEVFKLNKQSNFNLTGEMKVRTTFTGQEIVLTAIHRERVVTLKTDYDFLDHEFKSKTLLQLDPNAWASYDLRIINKTNIDKSEDHVELNFAYPRRNFTVSGYYQLSNASLSSEMTFVWDKQVNKKTVGASFDWKRLSVVPNTQHAVVSIKHPSFVRDVTLNAHYFSDAKDLFNLNTDLVYSADDNKKLTFTSKVQDTSRANAKYYNFLFLGNHPATRMDLNINGDVAMTGSVYETNSAAKYKRSYLPLQYGHTKAKLDLISKNIVLEKSSQNDISFLKGKFEGIYPIYDVTGTLAKADTDLNSTGEFHMDFHEKLLTANINFTPDASQSFHTYGRIPDSRNAVFNVWRVYDELSLTDVAFYIRLNHSRLVTSKLIWRPDLENEIRNGLHDFFDESRDAFYDTVDYWKQYIKSETSEAINDIWLDAKPVLQDFLEDISELKTLEDDIEDFRTFLSDSYNRNEFYIKDIVNVTSYLIDELAIRGHIESFPDILNEIWEIMGESGEAIRNSLIWIIEALKSSYKNAVEFIHSILRGDAMAHLSAMVEALVEKYDKFVKDLHVSFMKHIVNFWHKFTDMIKTNWSNMMLAVEPTVIKIAHYIDLSLHLINVELLELLYQRKSDIVGSPYYAKFANFTQDLDKIYKDIEANDWYTNIKKYSKIAFDFLRDRYFTIVPFGKELQDIANEIFEEFKQLLKLPSINYVLTKAKELYAKMEYLYDYFDVGTKVTRALSFLQAKITDVAQTALQAENRYREAKTKFVFDPEEGIVELEQKLPMSWHAFNETPKFEEIPEYKAINDIQNYFISSNSTFWTFYYEYKPCTEPSNWLPPFSAKAIMAGPQHFMTFDRRFFEYRGSCSYLLAHDFVDGNFSLAVIYDPNNKREVYEIALLIDGQTLLIDIFQDSVKLKNGNVKQLPIQFGNTYVYQDAQMLTIENSQGFSMECNLKFDVCTFSLSGWYYGKTAGLLGTMDNEPSSDFLTSRNTVEQDVGLFAQSWALEPKKCSTSKNFAMELNKIDHEIKEICEMLFKNKLSEFSNCFAVVDPTPFMRMCLNSRVLNEREACTAAIAYMQACSMEYTPLRIPDICVKCRLNDTDLPEGHFIELNDRQVPMSSDVVFIVEAKECNKNVNDRKNIDLLVSSLSKEFSDVKLLQNRYAVVVFGGDGVFNKPRSIVVNNKIFANPQDIPQYFSNIAQGNGSSDIFGAIGYAAKLIFRPGVSKTFILLPCTNCDPGNMTLDYNVIHQVLIERHIVLHILMDDDFVFEKAREGKSFFGMDGKTAFTKKDVKGLVGDESLRNQVKLPKSMLGFCTPLALETNGTVFAAKKLETEGKKNNLSKKFATVFGKRVVASARPDSCQNCECTADDNGMSYMDCFGCETHIPSDIDYGFHQDGEYDEENIPAHQLMDSMSADEEEQVLSKM